MELALPMREVLNQNATTKTRSGRKREKELEAKDACHEAAESGTKKEI